MDDHSLWQIARCQQKEEDFARYNELLEKNKNGTIILAEQEALRVMRIDADRIMLRKAHAAALLRWRGHYIPPANW